MKEFDDSATKGKFDLEAYRKAKSILDRNGDLFKNPYIKGYGVGFTNNGFCFIVDLNPECIGQLGIGDELEGIPVYWRDYRKIFRTT